MWEEEEEEEEEEGEPDCSEVKVASLCLGSFDGSLQRVDITRGSGSSSGDGGEGGDYGMTVVSSTPSHFTPDDEE